MSPDELLAAADQARRHGRLLDFDARYVELFKSVQEGGRRRGTPMRFCWGPWVGRNGME